MNVKIERKKLAVSLAAPLAVGGLAALITKDNMLMFEVIEKPPLAPPGWLFPVAWTILYILMGLASYRVWTSDARKAGKQTAGVYYALSLVFNFGWPIIFFNAEKYLAAFIWLCLMWICTLLATVRFWKTDNAAGWLMLPYLLWTTFAGYLNMGIYLLS